MIFANISIYSKIITNKMPEAQTGTTASDAITADKEHNSAAETEVLPLDSKYTHAMVADTRSGFLVLINKEHP